VGELRRTTRPRTLWLGATSRPSTLNDSSDASLPRLCLFMHDLKTSGGVHKSFIVKLSANWPTSNWDGGGGPTATGQAMASLSRPDSSDETEQLTGNPPYSILSYSAGLRGCAMELSLLLPAVNGVLCRVAMSPAAGQGVVFAAAAGSHGCQRPRPRVV